VSGLGFVHVLDVQHRATSDSARSSSEPTEEADRTETGRLRRQDRRGRRRPGGLATASPHKDALLDLDVVARAAVEDVEAGSSDEHVVAVAAAEHVIAAAADQDVVAGAPLGCERDRVRGESVAIMSNEN
jgi:hypothetical protein